jgi:FixJ family two-component response regulator
VVDDDPLVCRAVSRLLRSAGFEARTFGTAAALLESGFARQARFLVIDVHLGATTGFELVAALRAVGPCAPFAFITAFDDEMTRKQAQLSRPSGYLRKPFEGAALLEIVQAAVGVGG